MKRTSFLRLCAALLLVLAPFHIIHAQSRPPHPVQVVVSPDKADWNYKVGEEATFRITVLKHQVPLKDATVTFAIGPEKMPAVHKGTVTLKSGTGIAGKGKLKEPGFLRCEATVEVDGITYRGLATAGYEAESIKPTQVLPADFREFWDRAKAEARKTPMDAKLRLLPEYSTAGVDAYEVSIPNMTPTSRIYGILCIPKKPGKYPAVLSVPGAGIRPYRGVTGLAGEGVITLQIGIHAIPVTMNEGVYNDLLAGALRNYMFMNLDDRDNYYFKRVYLGCVRAMDFLTSLPEYDGSTLAVWGGSQGGALSIVTAALDDRVKFLVSMYPALSDLTGYLHGRAGGWPHLFTGANKEFTDKQDKIAVSAYYDVVNFARFVNVPGFYTWGYNDETCPPTSYYAAYNLITAPKELYLIQETGHWTFPEQWSRIQDWLLKQLK